MACVRAAPVTRPPGTRQHATTSKGVAGRARRVRPTARVVAQTIAWFRVHGPASVQDYARAALVTYSCAGQRVLAALGPDGLTECPDAPGRYQVSGTPKLG
jgi:hypothetical protein